MILLGNGPGIVRVDEATGKITELRFTFEASNPLGVFRKQVRQCFYRNIASEFGILPR